MEIEYSGHRYRLQNLKAEGHQTLQFMQDEPRHPKRAGTSCQEVIRALIDRVQVLDAESPWVGNREIVSHLRQALAGFEARALIRKAGKGFAVESLPVADDGHLKL